jgi:hypothetical protein
LDSYCRCGVALEDPIHYGWHKIKTWNDQVFAAARQKSMDEFEKRLPKKKDKEEIKWSSLNI